MNLILAYLYECLIYTLFLMVRALEDRWFNEHVIPIPEHVAAFYRKPTQCQPDFRFMGLVLQLHQFIGGLYAYIACLLVLNIA